MQDHSGTFIVLEGSDGSGKATQFKLLSARLRAMGYEVAVFDFPRYDQNSSHFVKKYLNGEYGPAASISPYTASLFYALDRFEASSDIKKALLQGKIVLSNRYVGSNMAHQGSKFASPVEQRSFFVWEDNLEYELLGIPRPSISIFLRVPAEVSFELIGKKAGREYTSRSHDEHENDMEHLKKSIETYDTLCKLFPKDFKAIECTQDGGLLSIPEVNDRIWGSIKPLLPINPPNPGQSLTISLDDDKIKLRNEKRDDRANVSTVGRQDSLVYHFKSLSLAAANLFSVNGGKIRRSANPWSKTGQKPYFAPTGMPKPLGAEYKASMEKLAALHSQMQEKLGRYLGPNSSEKVYKELSAVVPLAAQIEGTLTIDERSIIPILEASRSRKSPEIQEASKALKKQASQMWSEQTRSLKSTDSKDDRLIDDLVNELSPHTSAESESMRILQAWPRREFELLADALYAHSNLTREDILLGIEKWTYQRKYQGLRMAIHDPKANILSKVKYSVDMIIDQVALNDLLASGLAEDIQIQEATPRYGYEVPEIIEKAGIENLYMDSFDESLKLYSSLQASPEDYLAVYAVLQGHKVRTQLTINASALHTKINNKVISTADKILLDQLFQKIGEVHPIIAEAIGQPDTPELRPNTTVARPARPKARRRRRSNKR